MKNGCLKLYEEANSHVDVIRRIFKSHFKYVLMTPGEKTWGRGAEKIHFHVIKLFGKNCLYRPVVGVSMCR